MPDHRHAARRRHRVVGRLASLGLPLLLVLLELRPALPTAAISSKLPGRRCTALIPHASYSSLEEALAACDVLETCAAVHEEAKQKERARKDPISGKSGSKGYSYAPATYALCSTDSLFLAHWELLPGGRLRAAVHSSAAKPLDPSRVSKEACRILNPQANHTTASATAPALGLMPPSCKAKGASPADETPTATTADGAPASAYHHRAGGCLERLVTESAARATSDGALCCRDDAHAGHFLDAVRARLGQPEMVEHLWDHIDATLATAPNYVRKILSDLVVLHCYHSCDPANVKPQPGVLTLAASGGAGKGGGRTGGLRDVLADACAQGPQSWKWSARYAFVASSWSEFNAIESASSRDSYRLAGCLDPKRRRFETMGPICYRCGRFVADPRGGGYGGGGGDGDGDGGGGSGGGGGGSGSGSGSIRASDRNVIQLGTALASAVWPDYDSPGIGKAWSGVNHFPHFFEFAAPAFSFLRWRHALGQDGPQNVIVDGAADFDQNPHHKTGTQWVNTVWATVVRGYDGAAVRRVEPPSSMASTNVDRQSSVGAKMRADADAGAGATTSASANAIANSAGSARRLNKSKPKSAGGTKYGISSNGTVIMRNNFFGCDGDDAPHRAPLAGVNSDGRTVCLNGYITGPLGKGTHDSEVQWFFHPLDGLKLAQAIVQHGDYVAAAKGREGESGTGHVQPEQPIITSGPDPKFREFFEEKVQRGPPRIEIVNRKGSRSVPNMGELIDLLTHFDEEKLEELHFEKLAPVDQTRLMTNTDILITPHGAGMVNTFAMPPCGAVIEMFPLGYVLPGLFGNLVAESGKLYYPWFSGTASPRNGHSHSVPTSRVKGVPYEKAKVTTLSRTAQQRSFNISVPEVHTLVLNAIAARAVCLSAAAAPAAEAHPTRIDPVLD